MFLSEQLQAKWADVLDHPDLEKITDPYRRAVTTKLLENQAQALMEDGAANAAGAMPDSGGVAKFDPILISLVRRAMPNLIAYDICGVQPMSGPTGLIFAMKSKYSTQGGDEALFGEADTGFSGQTAGSHAGSNPVNGAYTSGTAVDTTAAENWGGSGVPTGPAFNEMAFSIEKTSVVAQSRALKAEYTIELAQDLKAVHGLDAETELSNILSSEILAEINREVVRTIYVAARPGAHAGTAVQGAFDLDVDSNGRWSVEKFKGLMFQIEREANVVAQQTRRGKANFIICSSDVASALSMAGTLDYTSGLRDTLQVDDTGNTFAGVLNGRYRVYIDPYSANANDANQFFVVGYRGASPYDAGMFYCPYVPLQLVRAVDPSTFQPKIGFKTRYGLVANPFTSLSANQNIYYRRVKVLNLM